jgi:hypothetical protein
MVTRPNHEFTRRYHHHFGAVRAIAEYASWIGRAAVSACAVELAARMSNAAAKKTKRTQTRAFDGRRGRVRPEQCSNVSCFRGCLSGGYPIPSKKQEPRFARVLRHQRNSGTMDLCRTSDDQ